MAMSKFCVISLVVTAICATPALVNAQVNIHSIEHRGRTGDRNNIVVSGTTSSGNFTFSTLGLGGRGEIVIIPNANSPEALLANKTILAELEMVDSQLGEMKRVRADHASKVSELADFDFGSDVSGQILDFAEQFDQIEADHQSQVQAVLLPHQLQRMNEISLRVSLSPNAQGQKVADAIARALGMDDDERKRFMTRVMEIEKEANRRIEQIKAEAREQVLAELTGEQRKKLEDLKGSSLERFRSNPPAKQVQTFPGRENQ